MADEPRKERPPAGSALKSMYNRSMDEIRKQAQKRLNTRQPGRKGGVR